MKVVLMQDVPDLGKAGEIKEVAETYAHDYLLPNGYAAEATKDSFQQISENDKQLGGPDREMLLKIHSLLKRMLRDIKKHDAERLQKINQDLVEAELLQKINQGLPSEIGQRYSALIAKRDAEELTSDEHEELLSLTDQVEELEAQRVAYLVELARLRNTSVTELIQELDIRPSVYV